MSRIFNLLCCCCSCCGSPLGDVEQASHQPVALHPASTTTGNNREVRISDEGGGVNANTPPNQIDNQDVRIDIPAPNVNTTTTTTHYRPRLEPELEPKTLLSSFVGDVEMTTTDSGQMSNNVEERFGTSTAENAPHDNCGGDLGEEDGSVSTFAEMEFTSVADDEPTNNDPLGTSFSSIIDTESSVPKIEQAHENSVFTRLENHNNERLTMSPKPKRSKKVKPKRKTLHFSDENRNEIVLPTSPISTHSQSQSIDELASRSAEEENNMELHTDDDIVPMDNDESDHVTTGQLNEDGGGGAPLGRRRRSMLPNSIVESATHRKSYFGEYQRATGLSSDVLKQLKELQKKRMLEESTEQSYPE